MTDFRLPYGKGCLTLTLPDGYPVEVIAPQDTPAAPDPLAEVTRALDNPLGTRLEDFAGARSAAIAVNDKTRPVPHAHLLPPLLARLERLGLPPERITLLIATGAHAPMPPEEFGQVIPADVLARYPVFCHDCDDADNLLMLGNTTRGTPVWIDRRYLAADLRIVVGDIEPHQFMGFSGGVKSAAIGLAGRTTITANHTLLTDPHSTLGRYHDNPTRQDAEEIGQMADVHIALNAILNRERQIVRALAGNPRAVMEAGIPLVRAICQVQVGAPFDLVIASPGGHPKDINLYQAQKALAHAVPITREGGTVILAAACPEGTGGASYEQWMLSEGMDSYEAVFARFRREGFRIGPHKAYQIARDAARARTFLVSEMPPDLVRRLLLTPASLEEAVVLALATLPPGARIGVMPLANVTVPILAEQIAPDSAGSG